MLAFVGGHWFTGSAFEERTAYALAGLLTFEAPARVDSTLGSDDYGDTSVGEAMYLHSLGVLDNLALLKLWSEATPQAIFPGRNLGCLRPGCEASFLVLRGDPISDFGHVRDIVLRVKQGHVLPAFTPE